MLSSTMSVSTNPGQIAFTVTPWGAASNATSFVSPSTACLDDTYAARFGPIGTLLEVEAMLMTRPALRSNISPMISRIV